MLEGFRHSIRQYEKIAPDVTLKELTAHARQLFAKAYVEAVVYGNLEADKVQPIMERIVSDLSQQGLPPEERFHEQVRQIPAGTTLTFQQEVTVNNSALVLELQQGDDTRKLGNSPGTFQWIQPQFYNELRTRQQTGYIVSSGSTLTEETLSLFFLIQSGILSDDLQSAYEAFCQNSTKISRISVSRNLKRSAALSCELVWSVLMNRGRCLFRFFSKKMEILISRVTTSVPGILGDQDFCNEDVRCWS